MPRISFKIVCKSLSYLVPFERVVWSTGKAGNNSKINSNFLTSLASLIILEIEGRGHRVHNLCLIIIVYNHHHNRNPSTPAWFLFLPNEKDPAHEWERALLASIPSSVNSYNIFYICTFRTNTNTKMSSWFRSDKCCSIYPSRCHNLPPTFEIIIKFSKIFQSQHREFQNLWEVHRQSQVQNLLRQT